MNQRSIALALLTLCAPLCPAANTNYFNPPRHFSEYNLDTTFNLFTDDLALVKHLPLAALELPTATNATIPLTNLAGIALRTTDWKSLLHDPKPATDPLASNIPGDQHAIFFPSLDAVTHLTEAADHDLAPLLQIFNSNAESAATLSRYETQLCLEPNYLSRLIGPKLISSLALTGSDPYFSTGSDLAVLFETTSPKTLKTLIQAAQALARQSNPLIKSLSGEISGVPFIATVCDDRSVSSYLASLDNVVLVSNSRSQLERLISVAQRKIPSIASQPDYLYFRQKFPCANTNETAFLVLSDATIHRWCSPQSRVAHSRRLRAAAGQAVLEAAAITNITPAEAAAYTRWRNSYEQNWSHFFNPLALRLSLQSKRLAAELCVTPLPTTSELRPLLPLTTNARLAPSDPHPDAILHLALAINPESEPLKEAFNLLSGFSPTAKTNPLAWLGQRVSIYADDDPFWTELAQAENSAAFLERNYQRLPVALDCEVKNPFSFALFLIAARGFAAQAAGAATRWDDLDYGGQPYTRLILPQKPRTESGPTNLSIYYAATTNALIVTPSERVLKRALDRYRSTPNPADSSPWPGTNLSLAIHQPSISILEALLRKSGPEKILALTNFTGANFGVTLESDALTAKLVLNRATSQPAR